jgi:hypothetical protein
MSFGASVTVADALKNFGLPVSSDVHTPGRRISPSGGPPHAHAEERLDYLSRAIVANAASISMSLLAFRTWSFSPRSRAAIVRSEGPLR